MKIIKITSFILLFLVSIKSRAQYVLDWNGRSETFTNGASNLVSYIDFGEVALWGSVEISLTSDFNHQLSTGLYKKQYNVGRNIDYMHANTSEVTSAFGPVADQWKLGDFEVNNANHLVVPIYHLTATGNAITVQIKGFSMIPFNTSIIAITAPVVFANNQTREYNYIHGKLSVGTSKADNDAILTVAGNIKSREIKVKVDAGADFVFEDHYKLPQLDSIEHFVEINNHLPDIPSANEMKASGLEVGSFQIKLLQKIEELTLHLIQKDKEIKSLENLKEKIVELEMKINKLIK